MDVKRTPYEDAEEEARASAALIAAAPEMYEALKELLPMFEEVTEGLWWCPVCKEAVPGKEVTYEERHEVCGAYLGDINDYGWLEKARKAIAKAEGRERSIVNPIRVSVCARCEKDEMYITLQDCMGCSHNRQDEMTIWCSWAPAEKPCEGCGIPAGLCEPSSCQIAQTIEKAAM